MLRSCHGACDGRSSDTCVCTVDTCVGTVDVYVCKYTGDAHCYARTPRHSQAYRTIIKEVEFIKRVSEQSQQGNSMPVRDAACSRVEMDRGGATGPGANLSALAGGFQCGAPPRIPRSTLVCRPMLRFA